MLYATVLFVHSLLRWLVVGAGAFALFKSASAKDGPYEKGHAVASKVFVASFHLNLLLGILLYVALSPTTTAGFGAMGAAMKNSVTRFFLVEHPFGMVVAVILATVGSAKIRRSQEDALKHKRTLIFYGLALLILLGSIPWPFYPAGRPLLSLPF